MTKGLLISRKEKLRLQVLSKTKPDLFKTKYKTYLNLYNKVLRKSKLIHYNNK